METTETVQALEVQRILVQDIDKLNDRSYVVDRCDKPIDGFKCIYDLLEIPSAYRMVIQVIKTTMTTSLMNRLSSTSDEKSTSSLVHESQFYPGHYQHLKHVQLLAKSTTVWTKPKNQNHYYHHDGVVAVVVDDKLKVSSPYRYGSDAYPFLVYKDDASGKYIIKALATEFDLFDVVTAHSNYYRGTDQNTLDNKIINAINRVNFVTSNFNLKEVSRETLNEWLKMFGDLTELPIVNTEGIVKTLNPLKGFYENLIPRDLTSALAFKYVADSCKNTVNGIKYSTVFNKLFANITTQEDFDKKNFELSEIFVKNLSNIYYGKNQYLEGVLDTLSEAREMKKTVLKKKATGAFNKIMDDIEFIQMDQVKYPLSYAAVQSGEIPTSTFFRKSGESYFIYNDNWDIWETVLADPQYKEVAIAIAAECSKRTTYEKDIMSYLYFTIFQLPQYLERHTGKKWKGIPKLVDSADELEPPTAEGTVKTRSALTPIVDNEKSEVVVPYVSMRISGYQTTYCYGLTYTVLEKGFSFNGNVVTNDVEEKLNGRDNYGLMFYTLTGTAQGRGYPTFLIIFENMDKDKYGQNYRVHFHRTHPMRSKGGDYNPIHNWTKGCYKWMIGNVNYERILAQQGDLAFVAIEADQMPEGDFTKVDSYDNHKFSSPVDFIPYTKKEKQNILGYVALEQNTVLNHNEHLNREIPKGFYEIRQCRSWEANPKGIWSLRID